MRRYLAVFIVSFGVPFAACWLFVALEFPKIGDSDYWLTRAHTDEIAKCDLGDIAIVGDSTALADIMPSRIGPRVENFGLNGGSPLTGYFISKAMLKCPQLPKAIIIAFVAGNLSSTPSRIVTPSAYYWNAVKYGTVGLSDALQVLKLSRSLGDTEFAGPPSLFDVDYRIRAFLYKIEFPPLYVSELTSFAREVLLGHATAKHEKNFSLYRESVLENGHHFMGTEADGGTELDSDINRAGNLVSAMAAFYVRQTIENFAKRGVAVYFLESPRDRDSVIHYNPSTITQYQNFLAELKRSEPNFHVIDGGFHIWPTTLFGDARHLNFRGAMILSDDVRKALYSNDLKGMVYSAMVTTANLYGKEINNRASWQTDGGGVTTASGIDLPDLAYTPEAPAPLEFAAAGSSGDVPSSFAAPPRNLDARAHYAVSAFVKNGGASEVSLRLNWPKGITGGVTWDFAEHKILYSGTVTALNSGVTVCPGGWIQMFISGVAGSSDVYSGPALNVLGKGAAVYIYDMSLEKSVWPTNYCATQLGEAGTVELHHNAQGAS